MFEERRQLSSTLLLLALLCCFPVSCPPGPPASLGPPCGPPASLGPPSGPPASLVPPCGPPDSLGPPCGPPVDSWVPLLPSSSLASVLTTNSLGQRSLPWGVPRDLHKKFSLYSALCYQVSKVYFDNCEIIIRTIMHQKITNCLSGVTGV